MGSRGPQLQAVLILLLVLSWVTVSLRCWVRLRLIKAFKLDDWFTVATLLAFTAYSGTVFWGIAWGSGTHTLDLRIEQWRKVLQSWYYGEILYILATLLLRFAIGTFLLRIAVRRSHRWTIFILLGANILFAIFYLAVTIFQCHPVHFYWDRLTSAKGKCLPNEFTRDAVFAATGVTVVTDWGFGILPVFIVRELRLAPRKKVAVAVVMGLGAITCITTLIRIPYAIQLTTSRDFFYDSVDVAIWSSLEPGLGLTVISLATLRPLFKNALDVVHRSRMSASRKSGDLEAVMAAAATDGDHMTLSTNASRKGMVTRSSTNASRKGMVTRSSTNASRKGALERSPSVLRDEIGRIVKTVELEVEHEEVEPEEMQHEEREKGNSAF